MSPPPESTEFTLRTMRPEEAPEVARLIFESTNHWYESKGFGKIFQGQPQDCLVFTNVYEDLDPGCCWVAVSNETGELLGSCFHHPRESHDSLGIMNARPSSGGKGVAKALLNKIIALSEEKGQTLRLVSSCFNLDSFSLYTRQGFAPYAFYQDMFLPVPESGVPLLSLPGVSTRAATLEDVDAIDALERRVWQTSRSKDWRYFIENKRGIWHVSVAEDTSGDVIGALASVYHPGGSNLLGPGLATDAAVADQLIRVELDQHRGRSPVFLIPSHERQLVASMYQLGARNCELHVAQSLGKPPAIKGIVLPTFMPETG